MAKKIREAESEWIHFIIVIGDKEVEGGELVVRERLSKSQYSINLENLIKNIKLQVSDKPYLPLNLPSYLVQATNNHGLIRRNDHMLNRAFDSNVFIFRN